MKFPIQYTNGDCKVVLQSDGTRTVQGNYLDYPLNLDIRISTQCSFGQKPDGRFGLCPFCHESAKVEGEFCNFENLKKVLEPLPPIELAIGCNQFTPEFIEFLQWAQNRFICNITINSGHLVRDYESITTCLEEKLIHGIGVSYRKGVPIGNWILNNPNTVVHVIAGIDDFDTVKNLNFPKVLVLGCKDFGFNLGKVDLERVRIWKNRIYELIENRHVCFDNLAVDQLNIKRFFTDESWSKFYQHEFSFYINAVTETFSPSSRHPEIVSWKETNVKDYFQKTQEIK